MKLTRNLFIPALDVSADHKGQFVAIDKSTIFEFAFNPNTETYSFICNKNDSNEVTGYAPTMGQEIVLDNENPMYAYLHPRFMEMPTGSDCVIPCLLIEPDMKTGKPTVGRLWKEATVVPDNLNSVDGKLAFTINFNGDPVVGTVAIAAGKITFTEGAEPETRGN